MRKDIMGLFPTDDPAYAATFAEESAMVDAAELIAAALEESGISRAELARRLGVSRSEITSRLVGERNITVRKLAATLHALGSTLELSSSRSGADRPEPRVSQRWRAVEEHHEESDMVAPAARHWALTPDAR